MLPLRLAVGAIFFAHGSQKLLGWFGGLGLTGTIRTYRDGLEIPAFFTLIATFAEFFGGIFITLGFLTRISALLLSAVMLVAIFKIHWVHGFFLNWFSMPLKGHGVEYSLSLLGACLTLAAAGPKRPSLDHWLYRRKNNAPAKKISPADDKKEECRKSWLKFRKVIQFINVRNCGNKI